MGCNVFSQLTTGLPTLFTVFFSPNKTISLRSHLLIFSFMPLSIKEALTLVAM